MQRGEQTDAHADHAPDERGDRKTAHDRHVIVASRRRGAGHEAPPFRSVDAPSLCRRHASGGTPSTPLAAARETFRRTRRSDVARCRDFGPRCVRQGERVLTCLGGGPSTPSGSPQHQRRVMRFAFAAGILPACSRIAFVRPDRVRGGWPAAPPCPTGLRSVGTGASSPTGRGKRGGAPRRSLARSDRSAAVDSSTAPGKGLDYANVGSFGLSGNNVVTLASGLRVPVNEHRILGAAYERPATQLKDGLEQRVTFNATLELLPAGRVAKRLRRFSPRFRG